MRRRAKIRDTHEVADRLSELADLLRSAPSVELVPPPRKRRGLSTEKLAELSRNMKERTNVSKTKEELRGLTKKELLTLCKENRIMSSSLARSQPKARLLEAILEWLDYPERFELLRSFKSGQQSPL